MKLSYIHGFGNKGNTFVAQDILTNSLPYQANLNATPQYQTPDYFLPSSSSKSYYSKKYSGNHATSTSIGSNAICQSKSSKISRVALVMLLSLGLVATVVEVKASDNIELHHEASSGQQKEYKFEATHLSNNLPDVVPEFPLPDLIPSNPPVTPPPPPMPPLPDIVPPPVILPDVVQVASAPPAAPMALSQPDLVSDAGNSKSDKKTALLQSIRDFGGKLFKLKKVKQEPKPVVVSSGDQDLMSQLHNTLERRRNGIAGEKSDAKPKKVVKQAPKFTDQEWQEIKRKRLEEAAVIARKNAAMREENAQVTADEERRRREENAAFFRSKLEQRRRESGENTESERNGIDPILHNNIVADLRQEINSLKEKLKLNGNVTAGAINDLDSNDHARSKRSLENNEVVENKDQSTSTNKKAEILSLKKDEAISSYSDSDSGYDESLEDSGGIGTINGSDTNDVVSRIVPQSKSIVSETVRDELVDIEKELQSQVLKEEEEVAAVEDILSEDFITDTVEPVDTNNNSPARPQEELAKRASIIVKARADLRFGSKMLSKQIRHRLLTRDIGSLVAVSAGDEEESQAPSYSVWSSGIFGGSKQKDTSNIIGHSSKIHGGTIGGEINLSSDLMFGVSYSRLSSKFKYPSMLDANQRVSRTNTNIFSVYSGATLAANTNLQTLASVALSGKDAKQKNIIKPKSKLFSFESHLNQKITFQNNITLIPSIGFRYEYGRIGASREQILNSYIVHHKRSKSSTLSWELGSRVLFTPIKLSSDFKLIPTLHISLEKSIVGRGANSGQLLSVKDIGGKSAVVSGSANHEKLSTNIGGGLIASHKNISLEFLYDLQKQRNFKSHQGVLKLKVNL